MRIKISARYCCTIYIIISIQCIVVDYSFILFLIYAISAQATAQYFILDITRRRLTIPR